MGKNDGIYIKIQADVKDAKESVKSLNKAVKDVGDTAKSSSRESATAAQAQARAIQNAAVTTERGSRGLLKTERERLSVTKELSRALDGLKSSVSNSGAAWNRFSSTATSSLDKVKAQVFSIQSALVAIGAGVAARGMFNVAVSFETLELSLRTITGSAEEAKKAMDWITDFTATTPYELEAVADAFKKLSAYGLAPQKYLRALGDTAAAMGKSLDQAVEMFADATTGEFERLKEFGMRAEVEGDKVTFSWLQNGQQMQKTVEKTGTAISSALGEIMQARFAGGMELLASGWAGMWSNLRDQVTLFAKAVMDAGVFDYLKERLSEILSTLTRMTQDGSLKAMAQDIGEGITGALDKLGAAIANLKRVYDTIPEGLGLMIFGASWGAMAGARGGVGGAFAGAQAGAVIGGTISTINALAQSFEGLKKAASGEIGIWDYITSNKQELEALIDASDAERVAKEQAKADQIEAIDAQKNANLLARYSGYIEKQNSIEAASAAAKKVIEEDLATFRAVKWDEVLDVIKSKLKEAETAEKKYAEQVQRLQEERARVGMTAQEKVRAMMRTTMTESQAYDDRMKEANESMNKAKLALSGGNAELSQTWAKKAQEQFADLNHEVKEGERVIVGAAQAQSIAVNGYLEATRAVEKALLAQEKVVESSRVEEEKKLNQLKTDLTTIKELQDAVASLEIKMNAEDKATPVLNEIQKELDQIKDKTVTVTVRYRKEGDGMSTGGLVQAFAQGGQAWRRIVGKVAGPGTGTSDSIFAKLSNGEFVIRAAAVRKFGASFFEALNRGIMPPMPKYAMGGPVNAISMMPRSSETVNLNFRVGEKEFPIRVLQDDRSLLRMVTDELSRTSLVCGQ